MDHQISSMSLYKSLKIASAGIVASLGVITTGWAQSNQDSVYTLRTVVVSEHSRQREVRSSTPLQILNAHTLETLNVLQLSDAVKYFSGVIVKDYGGLGGLKTVSIRSLGANHTAINYDGITINDAQTGQIDLGKFSLDNVEAISVSAGQGNDIFQPARILASAGVLNIQTLVPQLTDRACAVRPTMTTGSFGLINPRLLVDFRLTNKLTNSLNTEYMSSNGRYPFTVFYGHEQDSVSHEKRRNSDVETFRTELSSFYTFNEKSKFRSKVFYYQSERGLPGSVAFYNEGTSNQRLWDKVFFVQGHYENYFNSKLAFQANGKFNWTYQRYLDPDYLGEQGKTENDYYQWEYYLSGSLLYRLFPEVAFSWASDATIQYMSADLNAFAYPTRFTALNALTVKYTGNRLMLVANVLSTGLQERVAYEAANHPDNNYGQRGRDLHELTPSVSLSYKVFPQKDLYLRLLYKEIFRAPTFNDLYYSEVGNPKLRPEYVAQYNAGITWMRKSSGLLSLLSLSVDSYYNKVEDKIVARPSANIFKWTIENIGRVDIYGTDVAFEAQVQLSERYKVIVSGAYTYQKAWDVTSKTDEVDKLHYKHQIPYTPEHSGSGRFVLENPLINLSYGIIYSGGRYSLGENIPENYVGGYTDQSISLNKKATLFNIPAFLTLEVLNFMDQQYDVIKNFPMPGRHFRLTISVKL